ncbi:MAG: hypothetical protein IKF99_01150 [Oscillospiraceae bacterium]|nr:hypothetical protein [Oscillospiraceae bacterium]
MEGDMAYLWIRIGDIGFKCEGRYEDVKTERQEFMDKLPAMQEMRLGSRIAFVSNGGLK